MLSNGHATTPYIASIPNDLLSPADSKYLKRLGSGSFGVVYGYPRNDIQIAIKEIAMKKSERAEIQTEIDAHKDLQHDNIVKYHGAREIGDSVFLFLEYVDGGSLLEYLHETKIDDTRSGLGVAQILTYSAQILDGLAYLHDKRIVHRDLRAANILRKRTDIMKITDFGISIKWDDSLTRGKSVFNSVIGNEYWMAPELNSLSKDVKGTRSVDIWSFGVVLLEFACVTPPFIQQLSRVRFLLKLCAEKVLPEVPEFVDPKIRFLIEKCMVYEAEERISAKDLFRLTLEVKENKVLKDTRRVQEEPNNLKPNFTPPNSLNSARSGNDSFQLFGLSDGGPHTETDSDGGSSRRLRRINRLYSYKDSLEDIFPQGSSALGSPDIEDVIVNRLWRPVSLHDLLELRDEPNLPEYHYTEFIIKCLQASQQQESDTDAMIQLFESIDQAALSQSYLQDLQDLFWKFTKESIYQTIHNSPNSPYSTNNPYSINNSVKSYQYSSEEWSLTELQAEQLCAGKLVNLVAEWCRVPGCDVDEHGISIRLVDEDGSAWIKLETAGEEHEVRSQHTHEQARYEHFYFSDRNLNRTLKEHCSVWLSTYPSVREFVNVKSKWGGLSLSVLIANQ